jgi:hypothetical protein
VNWRYQSNSKHPNKHHHHSKYQRKIKPYAFLAI